MSKAYMYYRLLLALRYGRPNSDGVASARLELQDVLIYLREEAAGVLQWTDQQTQDFMESLVVRSARIGPGLTYTEDDLKAKIADENRRLVEYGA